MQRPKLLLSINRYERKKDIGLAIKALSEVKASFGDARLIVAGGYDPRVSENTEHLKELQHLAKVRVWRIH